MSQEFILKNKEKKQIEIKTTEVTTELVTPAHITIQLERINCAMVQLTKQKADLEKKLEEANKLLA